MKYKNIRSAYNTLSFKIVTVVILVLAPIISLLIYYNYQSRATLMEQVKITHKNMIQTYMNQVDLQLRNSMGITLDMSLFQSDPLIVASGNTESSAAFAKYRIYTNLQNSLLTNSLIDVFFLYVPLSNTYILAKQNNVSNDELDELKSFVAKNYKKEITSNAYPKSQWLRTRFGKENGLVNISYGNRGIAAGAYTSTDRVMNNTIKKEFKNVQLFFSSAEKLDPTLTKLSHDTYVVSSKSSVADIMLSEILPKFTIFAALPFMQKYYVWISIFFALLVPILFVLLQIIVVNPLRKLTKTMLKIQNGDLSYRVRWRHASNEFEIVHSTFNNMMDEVQNLKINVYEEQIKVQKSQLRNLQLQIKPHFLINSLNMVNNLIDNEDLSSAKRLILNSVEYFRYMVKVDDDFVALNEEIKHVSTYLEIQQIRYNDKFTYSTQINQLIEDMLIPPMLIQNFVENSIKYAITMNKSLNISINIEYFEIDYYPYARITISDTGIGYSPDVLEQINSGKRYKDSLGEHLGISNSVQRLKILYNGKATWNFFNNNGATSEITMPALFDTETE